MFKFLFLIFLTQTQFFVKTDDDRIHFHVVSSTEHPPDLEKRIELLEAQFQKLLQQYPNLPVDNPLNCKEVQERGFKKSNIYHIQPKFSLQSFPVVCDMKTEGGGWTLILNRFDGFQNFYRGWDSYKAGFGNLAAEFWLGLEKLHLLTGSVDNELLVELVDWNNTQASARYNTFSIGSEEEGYVLKVLEGFSGDAGDSLKNQAGMRFSTKDKDQDLRHDVNCAEQSNAGWWYRDCKKCHLTGMYFKDNKSGAHFLKGMYWEAFRGVNYSLKQARMMIRPRVEPIKLQPEEKFN